VWTALSPLFLYSTRPLPPPLSCQRPGVGPGLLPPMLGRDVVSTSQRAVDTLDQAGQALGQLLTYLTKLDGELPGLMARAPPPAASSHAGHAAGGGVSAHSTPSLGFTGGPDSDARPYSSGMAWHGIGCG
jgi:hypothetical protein